MKTNVRVAIPGDRPDELTADAIVETKPSTASPEMKRRILAPFVERLDRRIQSETPDAGGRTITQWLRAPAHLARRRSEATVRARRRQRLADGDVLLLSGQLLEELEHLEARMADQHLLLAQVRRPVPAQLQVLRALERQTARYLRALDRIRSRRPNCRSCSELLTVHELTVDPLTTACASCDAAPNEKGH